MTRRWLLIGLILATALTGCLGDQGPELQDEAAPAPGQETAPHGEPTIEEGPIETRQKDGKWVATQSINITNGLGPATEVTYTLRAPAGGLSTDHRQARPEGTLDNGTGYWTQVILKAQADTEEQARRGVQSMELIHEDTLDGTDLRLVTKVTTPESDPTNVTDVDPEGLLGTTSTNRHARIQVHMPQGPHYHVDAETTSGGISVAGAYPDVQARTNSGGVSLAILPWTSGTLEASTDSGGVSVKLFGGSDNGYDVTADVNAGGVSVSIPNSEPVGEQSRTHKHVRTIGFADRPIQTTVDAQAGSGGVSVAAR